MRAAVINSFDGPGAVTVSEVDDPVVADGQVLVRVEAAAVGPWDPATTTGFFTAIGGMSTFPQILGWDLSGTVAEVGPGATPWSEGDRVLGYSPQPWSGTWAFAEAVCMPAAILTARPEGLDTNVAATGPVDAIIDLVGPVARPTAMAALRPGGRFVTTITGPLPEGLADAPRMINVQPDPDRLGELARFVLAGTLQVATGAVVALEDVRHAFELSAGAGAAKIVLRP